MCIRLIANPLLNVVFQGKRNLPAFMQKRVHTEKGCVKKSLFSHTPDYDLWSARRYWVRGAGQHADPLKIRIPPVPGTPPYRLKIPGKPPCGLRLFMIPMLLIMPRSRSA